jgi:protein SCO1/2
MSSRVRSRVIAILCYVVVGCARTPSSERVFELRGQILAVRPNHEVLIAHEDIKGFMPAMTMPYRVRDPQLLQGRVAGDLITATLVVAANDAWLTRIEKTGSAPVPAAESSDASAPASPLLRAGDAVPATALTDERGRALTFRDLRASAVAITFIYTRCPLPQFCPLMDRRFAEVQRIATADRALQKRVQLLSVSFDPDIDTPAVLRAHALKLGADPSLWRFVTARRAEVDRFASAFGVGVIRESDGTITHNLRTAVVGPDGRLFSVYDGSAWTPEQIADDMRRALQQ